MNVEEGSQENLGLDLSANGNNGRSDQRFESVSPRYEPDHSSRRSDETENGDFLRSRRDHFLLRDPESLYSEQQHSIYKSRFENAFRRVNDVTSPFDVSSVIRDDCFSPIFDDDSRRNGMVQNCSGAGGSGGGMREERLLSIEFQPGCPYTCSVCNNTEIGTSFEELEAHVLNEHSRNPCRYCSKTFGQKANRDRHMCLHTGDKPYGCPDCDERFSRGDKLKMHRIRSHGAQYPAYSSGKREKLRKDDDRELSSSTGRLTPSPVNEFTSSFRLNDIYSGGSYQSRPASVSDISGSLPSDVGDMFSVGRLSRWMLQRQTALSSSAGSDILSRIGWAPSGISPLVDEYERRASSSAMDWATGITLPTVSNVKVLFPKIETEEAPVK